MAEHSYQELLEENRRLRAENERPGAADPAVDGGSGGEQPGGEATGGPLFPR